MEFAAWAGKVYYYIVDKMEADVISATMDLAYVATGAFDIWWEGGCWEWCGLSILVLFLDSNHHNRDVAAGICILQEAGGLVTTANPPASIETDPIKEARLGSRLYLAVRYGHISSYTLENNY
jgi:myo-inositol-1(or 4)-monophosphatase